MKYKYYMLDKNTDKVRGTNNSAELVKSFSDYEENHRIAYAEWSNGLKVSSVFLGVDHGFNPDELPVLFEIMVFNLPQEDFKTGDEFQWRSTDVHETLTAFEELTDTLELLYGKPEEKYTYKSKPNSKGT